MIQEINDLIGKRHFVPDFGEQGWVELVDFMPHPATDVSGDMAIVNAARVSFLGESKGEDADKKLLFYLYKNRHTSPFEMVEFKFRICAPVITWWQLVRHRTFNLNLQSGRYTPFEENDFYIPAPDAWRKQSASNKQGSSDEVLSHDEQGEIMSALYKQYGDLHPFDYMHDESDGLSDLLKWYSDIGYSIYAAALKAGAAKEQARLFLPGWALYYTGIIKIDAHNLLNFFWRRLDLHAQEEIRQYAQVMHDPIFKTCLPWTAEAYETFKPG